jgi:hypothetical protein
MIVLVKVRQVSVTSIERSCTLNSKVLNVEHARGTCCSQSGALALHQGFACFHRVFIPGKYNTG